jgi:double-stranded uracil-DNA glycosylase
MIHEVGITPRRYPPANFNRFSNWKSGSPIFVNRTRGWTTRYRRTRSIVRVSGTKWNDIDRVRLRSTSKKSASLFCDRPTTALAFGRQQSENGFPEIFVLGSPSGAASGHWTLQPWRELAAWFGAGKSS